MADIKHDDPEFTTVGNSSVVVRLIRSLQEECANCRTPAQSGTRNGYSCPKHHDLVVDAFELLDELDDLLDSDPDDDLDTDDYEDICLFCHRSWTVCNCDDGSFTSEDLDNQLADEGESQ